MPLSDATGSTCDMSPLIKFHFWQPVFFTTEETSFLSETKEERGRFAVISENVGYDVNFKIINASTNKIICRSNVRPADDTKSPNLRDDSVTSPKVSK